MDTERPVRWVASSKRDFREFPDDVQDVMGYALHLAQQLLTGVLRPHRLAQQRLDRLLVDAGSTPALSR